MRFDGDRLHTIKGQNRQHPLGVGRVCFGLFGGLAEDSSGRKFPL
jgi:hypothetical protein